MRGRGLCILLALLPVAHASAQTSLGLSYVETKDLRLIYFDQLGYLAPHDLKRTTARMLHEARSADGGHLFDLVDIADVLDHENPKVTKDC